MTFVVDEPRGVLPSFEVKVPWWQEASPVLAEALGKFDTAFTVLRMLKAEGAFPGGAVTYLVYAPDIDPALLEPWPHELSDDPHRAAYATAAGMVEVVAWAESEVESAGIELVGTPAQDRSWNLSSTWKLQTSDGPLWLKATPKFLSHESAVLESLAGTGFVPELLAGRPGAALMRHVVGVDGYGVPAGGLEAAIDVLCQIQTALDRSLREPGRSMSIDGVPNVDFRELEESLTNLRERWGEALSVEERSRFDALLDELPDRYRSASVVKSTLVHGDFHGGNVRLRPDQPPVILDWGDSFHGNPLFDLDSVRNYDFPDAARIERFWLDRLADRTASSIDESWEALRPVAALRLAVTYQRFCDQIELAERPYHENDILPALQAGLQVSSAR